MDLCSDSMIPLRIVFHVLDGIGDELSPDRKEDEGMFIEILVDICTQADSVCDIVWLGDVRADIMHTHVIVGEPCSLVLGYQTLIVTQADWTRL